MLTTKLSELSEETVGINNCTPTELEMPKCSIVGFFKNTNSRNVQQIDD